MILAITFTLFLCAIVHAAMVWNRSVAFILRDSTSRGHAFLATWFAICGGYLTAVYL